MEKKDLTPYLSKFKLKPSIGKDKVDEETRQATLTRRLSRDFVTLEEASLSQLYTFQKKLGQGVYGSVFLCTNEISNEKVAVKSVNRVDMYLREPEILSFLKGCPGVLPIQKIVATQKRLLMEFPIAQTLKSWLETELYHERDFKTYLKRVFEVTMDLVEAVACIHAKEIIHRDIKPDNILMTNDKNGETKAVLIDFGFSKRTFQQQEKATYELVTPLYRAPEITQTDFSASKSQLYTTCIDEWSLGIVLYEILTGSLPFGGTDNMISIQMKINEWQKCLYYLRKKVSMKEGNILLNYRLALKKKFPNHWEESEQRLLCLFDNLLSNLLDPDPEQRYLCLDIIEHTNRYQTLQLIRETQQEALDEKLTINDKELATWQKFLSFHTKTDPKVLLFTGLLWFHFAPLVHPQEEEKPDRSMLELFGALKIGLEFFIYHSGVMRWAHLFGQEKESFDKSCLLLEHSYVARSKTKVFHPHKLYKFFKSDVELIHYIPLLARIFTT